MKYRDFCCLYDLVMDPDIDPDRDVDIPDRLVGLTSDGIRFEGYTPEDIYDAIYEHYAADSARLETRWVRVQVFRQARVYDKDDTLRTFDLELSETTIAVPPVEPPCVEDEHDWVLSTRDSALEPQNCTARGPFYSWRCRKCALTHTLLTEVDDPFSQSPGYTWEKYYFNEKLRGDSHEPG